MKRVLILKLKEVNVSIQKGDIYYSHENDIHYYILDSDEVNTHFINSLLYSDNIDTEDCKNDVLIKHYDDVEEGLIDFIKEFSEF